MTESQKYAWIMIAMCLVSAGLMIGLLILII